MKTSCYLQYRAIGNLIRVKIRVPGVPMLHANDDVVHQSSPNRGLAAASYILVVVY